MDADNTRALRDLVIANRVLAHEGVLDAYGHVSVRHPIRRNRFLLARSCSPALVTEVDIMEFDLAGVPTEDDSRHPYLERFIHAAAYEARDDVNVVAHSHAQEVLPFTITDAALRPVILSAGVTGCQIPCWDIRDRFGDTNMLVGSMEQARDLVARLGGNNVVLMRGHGFSAVARSLPELLRICIYVRVNARVLTTSLSLGEVRYLSEGEVARIRDVSPDAPEVWRAWSYWASRAGCEDLLAGHAVNESAPTSPVG